MAPEGRPADEDVGGRLDQALAGHHPLAVGGVDGRAEVGLVGRGTRLLALQEERVVAAAPLEEHEVDAHADAADADHLADHVGLGVPVEEVAPVLLQRRPVAAEQLVDEVGLLVVVDGRPHRRVLGDPGAAVGHLGQLGVGAAVGALGPLGLDVDGHPSPVGRLEVAEQAVDVGPVVPDVELGHPGVAPHPAPVRHDRRLDGGAGPSPPHPAGPGRHHQAGGQPVHVPLEGAGQGLVEVAQVEGEVAFGRGPQAEVEDVGVAAQLHLDAAVGTRAEVGGHHRGRSPVVVPGRQGHPPVAQGEEAGVADVLLVEDRLERVVAAERRRPPPLAAARRPLAGHLAGGARARGRWRRGRGGALRGRNGRGRVRSRDPTGAPTAPGRRAAHSRRTDDPTRRSLSGLRTMRIATTRPSATEQDRTWSTRPSTRTT